MSDPRTKAPRRRRGWLLMALIACLSSSCQFLGLDMYPPELQSASTSCDLPALVYDKTGYTFSRVNQIRQLSSGSTCLLFVLCETDSGNVVMVLDPATLAYRTYKTGVSMPLGVVAAGYFLASTQGYYPSTGLWSSVSTVVPISDYSSLLVSAADASPNVLLKADSDTLSILAADSVWPATMPSMCYSVQVSPSSSGNWRIEDAAASSSRTRLLLRNNENGLTYYIDYAGSPYALCDDVGTNMTATGFLANTTTAQKFTFYGEEDRCWLLDDCVVHVENNQESHITRLSLSDGIEIDSHLIDSNWKDSIYFEPTGERWYYYDTRVSKLCVLRTWW